MPLMEISILPLGSKSFSVSRNVSEAIKVLKKEKNIKYNITAMGTIVESKSLTTLFKLAEKMHRSVINKTGKRLVTTIHIDDRVDKETTINGKLKSLKKKIN